MGCFHPASQTIARQQPPVLRAARQSRLMMKHHPFITQERQRLEKREKEKEEEEEEEEEGDIYI